MAEISISKVKASWFPLHFLSFAITSRERTYPSRNAPSSTSPPSLHCRVDCRSTTEGGDGACGKEEKVGREEPGGRTVCGLWAGWVDDSILRDDFRALVQYSSTDAKRIQASKV